MSEPVRLQKFIADAGICSRREAEQLIREGRVSVNQQTAVIGQKVQPGVDRIVVDSRVIGAVQRDEVTLLYNKPKGVSCDRQPPEDLPSVFGSIPREFRGRTFRVPCELETESEGLVILTTDGELHNRLAHASGGVHKRYRALLEEPLPPAKIERLRKGFIFEGARIRVEEVRVLSRRNDGLVDHVELATLQGKKREVRRLFDFLRADLRRLKRVQIGRLVLKRIPLRLCRPLSQAEVALLGAIPEADKPVRSKPKAKKP